MKIVLTLLAISFALFSFSQQKSVDSIEGLGMFKFGSDREHCECNAESEKKSEAYYCEKFPNNLISNGYPVSKVSLQFSEKSNKLVVINVHFKDATKNQRQYILEELKKIYDETNVSDENGDRWVGKKNTVRLSLQDNLYISYIYRSEELD